MRRIRNFISYGMVCMLLIQLSACVSENFTEEANYRIYVPEVANKTVTNCRILIYNEFTKQLVGEKFSSFPFQENWELSNGIFSFVLPNGRYDIYCYTGTEEVEFRETTNLANSRLRLKDFYEALHLYSEPSEVYQYRYSTCLFAGDCHTSDTTHITPYVGKIVTRFRKQELLGQNIKILETRVKGVGVQQFLIKYGQPSHINSDEYETSRDDSFVETENWYEFEHNYFPTVENEIMTIGFNAYNEKEERIAVIEPFEIRDIQTHEPLKLGSGERIIIEIENGLVANISVEGWGGIIEGPGGNKPF